MEISHCDWEKKIDFGYVVYHSSPIKKRRKPVGLDWSRGLQATEPQIQAALKQIESFKRVKRMTTVAKESEATRVKD